MSSIKEHEQSNKFAEKNILVKLINWKSLLTHNIKTEFVTHIYVIIN